MNFLKTLFGQKQSATDDLLEGGVFYTFDGNQYHLYKLLNYDKDFDACHVLSYTPVEALPEKEDLSGLSVAIHHSPVARTAFANSITLFTKTTLTDEDLIGYREYLRLTQDDHDKALQAQKLYLEANQLCEEKQFQSAVEKYSEAIDIIPSFFEAIDNRGLTKMDLGLWQDAVNDFQLSLSVNPNAFLAEFSLGECYLRLADFGRAKEQFEKALAIDPSYETASAFLKIAEEELRD